MSSWKNYYLLQKLMQIQEVQWIAGLKLMQIQELFG